LYFSLLTINIKCKIYNIEEEEEEEAKLTAVEFYAEKSLDRGTVATTPESRTNLRTKLRATIALRGWSNITQEVV